MSEMEAAGFSLHRHATQHGSVMCRRLSRGVCAGGSVAEWLECRTRCKLESADHFSPSLQQLPGNNSGPALERVQPKHYVMCREKGKVNGW